MLSYDITMQTYLHHLTSFAHVLCKEKQPCDEKRSVGSVYPYEKSLGPLGTWHKKLILLTEPYILHSFIYKMQIGKSHHTDEGNEVGLRALGFETTVIKLLTF